jgi:hypothetical protein
VLNGYCDTLSVINVAEGIDVRECRMFSYLQHNCCQHCRFGLVQELPQYGQL